MIRNLRISAVVPCFNEEGGIRQVILRMPVRVDEIVVADNRSTDRTAEVARSMGARVIPVETRGYGAALAGGFAAATGDVIVSLDGDATYPPEEIPRLVGQLEDRQWDFLSACRFPLAEPSAMSGTNQLGNWILTQATRVLYWRSIRDSQSGMWVFRRSILPRLKLTSPGMAFSEEIKIEAILRGLRFGEVHIPYGERVGTVKLQKWRDGFHNLWFLVRKRVGWV